MPDKLNKEGRVIPTMGRIVYYHHAQDKRDWAAMVLDVDEERGVHVQVMRPRANEWHWTSEGDGPGQYRWPDYVPAATLQKIAEQDAKDKEIKRLLDEIERIEREREAAGSNAETGVGSGELPAPSPGEGTRSTGAEAETGQASGKGGI
jgi:hypothetical protein